MLHSLKKRLYFVVAGYFAFWAKFVLHRWKPRVIVITGSSGKTTLLHMLEAQIGDKAVYSHHANSAAGIPLHILDMIPNVPSKAAWMLYFIRAPFHIFRQVPKQKVYIVEADCDRPHEGEFTSKLVKPEVVLWVSVSNTHSMNFDSLVKSGRFATHEQAIAHEFGNFARAASNLVIANSDYSAINEELKTVRGTVKIQKVSASSLTDYELEAAITKFKLNGQQITMPGIHPKEAGASLQMARSLLDYLGLPFDAGFSKFHMPPGRNNILAGKKDTIIIDSTYNTGLGATIAVLNLFAQYPNNNKWLVISDILEQGSLEQSEHEQLAIQLAKATVEQIILLGRRNKAYTLPALQKLAPKLPVVSYEGPKEVLDYLNAHLKGDEAILFKGAQGLEGVIEQLLASPADDSQLVRRGAAWVRRRQGWGLPK